MSKDNISSNMKQLGILKGTTLELSMKLGTRDILVYKEEYKIVNKHLLGGEEN